MEGGVEAVPFGAARERLDGTRDVVSASDRCEEASGERNQLLKEIEPLEQQQNKLFQRWATQLALSDVSQLQHVA